MLGAKTGIMPGYTPRPSYMYNSDDRKGHHGAGARMMPGAKTVTICKEGERQRAGCIARGYLGRTYPERGNRARPADTLAY
jgi:hypothetical protein